MNGQQLVSITSSAMSHRASIAYFNDDSNDLNDYLTTALENSGHRDAIADGSTLESDTSASGTWCSSVAFERGVGARSARISIILSFMFLSCHSNYKNHYILTHTISKSLIICSNANDENSTRASRSNTGTSTNDDDDDGESFPMSLLQLPRCCGCHCTGRSSVHVSQKQGSRVDHHHKPSGPRLLLAKDFNRSRPHVRGS